jgi:hypothetical protein
MAPVLNSAVIAKNIPLRLSVGQMNDPRETLRRLYEEFSLNEMREVLWDVFGRTLIADDEALRDFSRADLLYYYERFVQILEAGSLVFGERQQ